MRAIVLAPTRELCHQVRRACAKLLRERADDARGELPAAAGRARCDRPRDRRRTCSRRRRRGWRSACVRGIFRRGRSRMGGWTWWFWTRRICCCRRYAEDIKRVMPR